jgi:hypothetical protein
MPFIDGVWSSKPRPEPWKVQKVRDYCCCQHFKLVESGNSDPSKGPTHYCPGCHYAFWLREIKPTAAQHEEYKKTHPGVSSTDMWYRQYKKTPDGVWGATAKTKMIDQLGGPNQPTFLLEADARYWRDLYCDKYPNSELGKARTQRRLEKKDRDKYGN